MNKKVTSLLVMLTLLLPVIAQVPVHAQTTPNLLPADTGKHIQDILFNGVSGKAAFPSTAANGHASALLPAMGLLYSMAYNFEKPASYSAKATLAGNAGDQFYVPMEYAWLYDQLGELLPEMTLPTYTGPVRNTTDTWWDDWPTNPEGAPVTPGTWAPLVDLGTNHGPGTLNYLPEFNPAIAANPMNQANQIEGQFDVSAPDLGTGQALRCSVKASPWTAASTYLPVVGDGAAGTIFGISFCERALPAFSDDGTAYVLWNDYELGIYAAAPFLVAHTTFNMIRSVDGGAHWTDLAGNAMNAGPNIVAPFNPIVRDFPLFGPPSGELPITPSLAVSGSGLATTRIHIAYATFTNLITNDIRSIESTNGGATFSNPVVIESVNPFLPGPLRLLLTPSNAYTQPGVVHVVWYDDIALPPLPFPGSAFRIAYARSTDNGVTYTAPATLAIRPESLIFDFATSATLMFAWPTESPHIAADAATNSVYVVVGESWSPFVWAPWEVFDLFFTHSTDGGTTWTAQYPFPEWHFNDVNVYFPAIAVEHVDGTVHVTYASREHVYANLPAIFNAWPWFDMVYTGATPAQLAVGQWVTGQRISGYVWDTWFLGLFFSVAANNGNVYAAFTASPVLTAATWPFPSLLNDDTWLGVGTKPPPPPVGGTVLPTDMATMLLPYMAVAILATLGLAYALRRRFRNISLPQIPNIR